MLHQHPRAGLDSCHGTLKYADNPPRRYQDIYNLDFYVQWRATAGAGRSSWIARGARAFRVDNLHQAVRVIRQRPLDPPRHPGDLPVQAFTRWPDLLELANSVSASRSPARIFTWKNSRSELSEYVNGLAHGEEREYFRPSSAFVNTP